MADKAPSSTSVPPPPPPAPDSKSAPPAKDSKTAANPGKEGDGPEPHKEHDAADKMMEPPMKQPSKCEKDFFLCVGMVLALAILCIIGTIVIYIMVIGKEGGILKDERFKSLAKREYWSVYVNIQMSSNFLSSTK